MMNKLPPRWYYRLDQAAKELGCDTDYLLHLGATSRAQLAIRSSGLLAAGDIHNGEEDTSTRLFSGSNTLLILFAHDLEDLEISPDKPIEVGSFATFWNPRFGVCTEDCDGFALGIFEYDFVCHESHERSQIKVCDLFIPYYEVDRLKSGENLSPNQIDRLQQKNRSENTNRVDTERTNLLKMIGLLALTIAEKNGKFKNGDKPNFNQIAEAAKEALNHLPDANKYGLTVRNIRSKLPEAWEALTKP